MRVRIAGLYLAPVGVAVGVLAGIVGVVSLAEASTNALIGVFISVVTIPKTSNIGVSSAFQEWSEAWGSALQLLSDVSIQMEVGLVGVLVQRQIPPRTSRCRETVEPHQGTRAY